MGRSYIMCLDKEDSEASDCYQDVVKFKYGLSLSKHTSMMVHIEKKKVEMAHEIASVILKNPAILKNISIGNDRDDEERKKTLRRAVFKMALIAVSEVGLSNKDKKIELLTNGKTEKYWMDLFTQNSPIKENYPIFQQIFGKMISKVL